MDKTFESDWSEEPTVTEHYRTCQEEVFGPPPGWKRLDGPPDLLGALGGLLHADLASRGEDDGEVGRG